MNKDTEIAIRAFLNYSFTPIGHRYELLTDRERELVTPKEFAALVEWLKGAA
jgi:hypothetical protein